MDQFAAYGLAILSVAICALMIQVLNALTGIRKSESGLAPGGSHGSDFSDASYRLDRTYLNSVETLAFFAALVFAAIIAGASPFWVNLLASFGLLLRIGQNYVFVQGIGKPYNGFRTRLATLSAMANAGLFILTLVAVFT